MRSIFSFLIVFSLVLFLDSCKTREQSVIKKLPELTLSKGSYYVSLPNYDNEYMYTLVLSIDTTGEFEYIYQSTIGEPNPMKITGKAAVQMDSSYILSNSLNNQQLKVKFDSSGNHILIEKGFDSIFLSGKYYLIDASGYSYSTYDVLMSASGFYFIAENKTDDWLLILSETGKYYIKFPDKDQLFSGAFSKREFEFAMENEISFEFMIESKLLKATIFEERCKLIHEHKTIISNEAITLNGCARFTKPQVLIDGTWKLTHLDGKAISELKFPARIPTITIQSSGSDLIGNNGCNNIFGNFRYYGDSIILSNPLGSTRMFCEKTDDLLFMEKFPMIKRFNVNGKILELWSDNEILFRFKRM